MREIKFRAWCKNCGEMLLVGCLSNLDYEDDDEHKYVVNASASAGVGDGVHQWLDIEPMQYTGLKDKNGKEIYEGDILRYKSDKTTSHHQVVFIERKASFGFLVEDRVRVFVRKRAEWDNSRFEVIGNTWENPELLK